MQQDNQAFAAAVAQWRPQMEKMAFAAARRAEKTSATLRIDDFRQILLMTLDACLRSYDPSKGAKFHTFFYTACWNEINKEFRKVERETELSPRRIDADGNIIEAVRMRVTSGDGFGGDDEDQQQSAWTQVEDDTQRNAENSYMDQELAVFVHKRLRDEARAVFAVLTHQHRLVGNQLRAYNAGVEQEAREGGMRRLSLDMNLVFVCRLFGLSNAKTKEIGEDIRMTIAAYGES